MNCPHRRDSLRKDELRRIWHSRLSEDYPHFNLEQCQSIVCWLLQEDLESLNPLSPKRLAITHQAMNYRYRILQQRYLGAKPAQAYRNLVSRLGSLVMLRTKIGNWVVFSRDRHGAVADLIQALVEEILKRDRLLQKQIAWIARCTEDTRVRDALLLSSIEEYCRRRIRHQPLLVYKVLNCLHCSQPERIASIIKDDLGPLIGEAANLCKTDFQTVASDRERQDWEQQQTQRLGRHQELEHYLVENVSELAIRWLRFYRRSLRREQQRRSLLLS